MNHARFHFFDPVRFLADIDNSLHPNVPPLQKPYSLFAAGFSPCIGALGSGMKFIFTQNIAVGLHSCREPSTVEAGSRNLIVASPPFLDLLEHRSNLLFAGIRDEGVIIVRVCEASALYCSRLEKEALDRESDINQAEHPTSSGSGDTSPKRFKLS